jgi:hypothetical protein
VRDDNKRAHGAVFEPSAMSAITLIEGRRVTKTEGAVTEIEGVAAEVGGMGGSTIRERVSDQNGMASSPMSTSSTAWS